MTVVYASIESPFGPMLAVGSQGAIAGLYFPEHRRGPSVATAWREDVDAFAALRDELAQYLAGERTRFTVPLDLTRGTVFQQRVWDELRAIPYGETVTYGELARRLGDPNGARAVAGAVARNPVSIVVPCHRVMGASGALTGFAGGTDAKRQLLELEGALLPAR